MTDAAERWARVRELYAQARQLPGAEREAWLAAQPAEPGVADEVRSLLAHAPAGPETEGPDGGGDSRDPFLTPPWLTGSATAGTGTSASDRGRRGVDPAWIGRRLGNWEIVATLGAGGMGDVYEARRADGSFEGRAAIKLIRRGMDSAAVLQRFSLERHALARLNHAHVARLFDAGLSDEGLPYFVMEKVDGVPVDVAARNLPVEARLRLFLQLADAVSHAHRQLLVHRDLKPGNVLVTAAGDVKLLDFGIAKALGAATDGAGAAAGPGDALEASAAMTAGDADGSRSRDAPSPLTLAGPQPLTPNYASPEQVRGEPVSVATDIYSLGVLLYQLLTGVRPTGRDAKTAAEAARQVLEQTPVPPSQVGSASVTGTADSRGLRGDLDAIVMKALEKTVARRYPSVDAMAADIEAHLQGRPVGAVPQTPRYLATKFVGRHRGAVAATALAVLTLVAGSAAVAWSAREARLARDDARQRLADVRQVLHDVVFRFGDSVAYLPGGMQIKEDLLNTTLAQLRRLAEGSDGRAGDPETVADVSALHARLAELQGMDTSPSTERPQQARANAARAIALGEQVWAARKADRQFANWLARAYQVKAQLERADGHPEQALQTLAALAPRIAESLALQKTVEDRAYLLSNQAAALILQAQLYASPSEPSKAQPALALKTFGDAEQAYVALLGLGDKALDALDAGGRPEEPRAKPSLLHALATVREGRALLRLRMDDTAAALPDAEQAVQAQEQAVTLDPQTVIWRDGAMAKNNTLAVVLLRLGRPGDAEAALAAAERSQALASALAASDGPQSRWAKVGPALAPQRARALAALGRHGEAVPIFEAAIQGLAAQVAAGGGATPRRRLGWMQWQLSRSLQALGRAAQAQPLAAAAVQTLRATTVAHADARDAWLDLAQALVWRAQLEAAAGRPAASPSAVPLHDEARAAYARAAAIAPLKAEHATLAQALAAAPASAPK